MPTPATPPNKHGHARSSSSWRWYAGWTVALTFALALTVVWCVALVWLVGLLATTVGL